MAASLGNGRWKARVLTVIGAALVALALPAAAQAWSIHNFRIRDAGPEIAAQVTVCTKVRPGYEQKFHFRAHVELVEGGDAHTVPFTGWYGRGCTEGTSRFRDTLLHWEGWYYGLS